MVAVSVRDIAALGLRYGLAFESEISFHKLTILHPDSKLGVGVLLFSNLSLLPTGDFLETTHLVPSSSSSSENAAKRVSYVHLESESLKSVFPGAEITTFLEALRQPSLTRTPVLFHPSPVAHLKSGEGGSKPILVLAGPRLPLEKSSQRRRLHHSLAKALYGVDYEQSYQKTRSGKWKHKPIGIRLQHFAFSVPGQQMADHGAWSMTLTVGAEEKPDLATAAQSNQTAQGLYYWSLFLINWISSLHV